jgi:hypothetical protein
VEDNSQITGEGGLAFETLNYLQAFLSNQTDFGQWKNAGTKCRVLAEQLNNVVWSGTYNCPSFGQPSQMCNWDATITATAITHKIQQVCTAIQLSTVSD